MKLQKSHLAGMLLMIILISCGFLNGISGRHEIATKIENAIVEECEIEVTVDPTTVPVYDIDYWTTVLSDNETRITCVAGNGIWTCNCDDS